MIVGSGSGTSGTCACPGSTSANGVKADPVSSRLRTACDPHLLRLDGPRFSYLIDAEVAVSNAEAAPGRTPSRDVLGGEMAIESGAITPALLYVNEPGVENVVRVSVFLAAVFRVARFDHERHQGMASASFAGARRKVPTITSMSVTLDPQDHSFLRRALTSVIHRAIGACGWPRSIRRFSEARLANGPNGRRR